VARRARKLSAFERRLLVEQITAAIPRGKGKAITHGRLWRALKGTLRDRKIPIFTAERVLGALRSRKVVLASTRIGLWRPDPEELAVARKAIPASEAPAAGGRRVRMVVQFVCMTCYLPYPSKKAGRAHWFSRHGRAK